MAIEVDTTSSTAPPNEISSLTWSHTVGSGSNTILVVCVPAPSHEDNPSSVKYNDEDLTLASHRYISDTSRNASVWYIVSPATGTNDIRVDYVGSTNFRFGMAISLFGVDQDNPVGATAGADGAAGTDRIVDITTERDNSYIIDNVATLNRMLVSPGTGQTLIDKYDHRGGSSYKKLSTAGETTMTWEKGASYPWVAVAVEFKEVSPSTGFLPLL